MLLFKCCTAFQCLSTVCNDHKVHKVWIQFRFNTNRLSVLVQSNKQCEKLKANTATVLTNTLYFNIHVIKKCLALCTNMLNIGIRKIQFANSSTPVIVFNTQFLVINGCSTETCRSCEYFTLYCIKWGNGGYFLFKFVVTPRCYLTKKEEFPHSRTAYVRII